MKKIKLNLKKWHKIILGVVSIVLLAYGFTDGMEWYRILSIMLGGLFMGIALKKK